MRMTTCQACCSTSLITTHESGFLVCGDCGQVQDRIWSFEPEKKWYDEEERRLREHAGEPLSMTHVIHLGLPSSTFLPASDYTGSSLDVREQVKFKRLLQYQIGAKVSRKRHFTKVLAEIKRTCYQLQLPESLAEEVLLLYVKASKKGFLKGRSKQQVIIALIYILATQKGIMIDLNDFTLRWGIKPRKIRRLIVMLRDMFNLDVHVKRRLVNVHLLIIKIGMELNVRPGSIRLASEIYFLAKKLDKNHALDGKRPSSIAAACIYLACISQKEHLTMDAISRKMGISKITLRKRIRQLTRMMKITVM